MQTRASGVGARNTKQDGIGCAARRRANPSPTRVGLWLCGAPGSQGSRAPAQHARANGAEEAVPSHPTDRSAHLHAHHHAPQALPAEPHHAAPGKSQQQIKVAASRRSPASRSRAEHIGPPTRRHAHLALAGRHQCRGAPFPQRSTAWRTGEPSCRLLADLQVVLFLVVRHAHLDSLTAASLSAKRR